MTIQTNSAGLVARLNAAGPNTLADILRQIGIGSLLRQATVCTLRRQNPDLNDGLNPYIVATTIGIGANGQLPDDAKASKVLRFTVTAGGATGEFTDKGFGVTPTTGTYSVTASGDIVTVETDEVTSADVTYIPEKQDVVELTLGAPAGVLTIPVAYKAVMLMEAEILTGTLPGKNIVLVPGAAPATTKANLSVDKTQVLFAVADAPTLVRVKLGVASAIDVNALFEALSTNL